MINLYDDLPGPLPIEGAVLRYLKKEILNCPKVESFSLFESFSAVPSIF